jgi:hypothetical protein
MGKTLTNLGVLVMIGGIFIFVVNPYLAGALLVVGFFVSVVGRMAT